MVIIQSKNINGEIYMLKKIFGILLLFLLGVVMIVFSLNGVKTRHKSNFIGNKVVKESIYNLTAESYSLVISTITMKGSCPSVNIDANAGSKPELVVFTDENILECLKVDIDENRHEIKIGCDKDITPSKFDVKISAPMKEFVGRGSFNLNVSQNNIPEFTSNVSGAISGNYLLKNVQSVSSTVYGSGKLKFSGSATNFEIKIDGSGEINALDFNVDNFTANGAGAGKIDAFVNSTVNLKLDGAWKFNYKGSPTIINNHSKEICKINKIK